ncbi:FAD binding domain-containing protein [Phytohabitans sp. ZYX-F-186]|uniref:FAD binding domain-containing protein n=1 Tax=Phytohabitans maris TaxID=3071409 RepID=A0ABU0ZCU2_9ACTN|nr:FAD binding domain-containing protein [Phytohabitans sp. ZYX-F-186]MDQ7904870.1 FAD binding domain-containing protein [Phytohabitans sp. ZYX-F-186]
MITAVRTPESVADAVGHAAAGGRLMGGGTVVMAQVNSGSLGSPEIVSLRRAGLGGIGVDGALARVGATATLTEVEESPELAFLRDAVRSVASPTIRNQATVGGNLFVPQPYGDLAVCLLALDATVEVAGPDGSRGAPVDVVLANGVAPGEVVTAVRLAVPAPGTWFYRKAMRRKLNSAAIVAVAAVVETGGGVVTSARIALGGVAPRPVRAASAERVLIGRPLETDVLDEAGRAARADIAPFDDAYASAWYRTRVLPVHLRRAFLG